jgi:hypothetical protein
LFQLTDRANKRPDLDETGFVVSQHTDFVRVKFHLHDLNHIGEELLEMDEGPLGALSKLLLKPADNLELIEELCVAKDENAVDIMCKKWCCNFLRKSRV